MRCDRLACGPCSGAPPKASSGTVYRPLPLPATPRWSAPRCATPSTTATASSSPCSASAPRTQARAARPLHRMATPLREKNLPLVVDNPRFLILPWITIPNLGSHILAIVRRRLPEDWTMSATNARPCSSKRLSRRRATPVPSTGPPAGSLSESRRDAGATTGTINMTNQKRTSGSGPSEKTGSESSTAESSPRDGRPLPEKIANERSPGKITRRPKVYDA